MISTRDKLIHTTAALIRRKGYFGTGISEVLAEVGVPKGSLYHHFPDGKDELIKAAIQYGGENQMMRYGVALKGKPAIEGFNAMVDVMIDDLLSSDFKDACPITAVAAVASSMDETIRVACEQIFKGWQDDLSGYLLRRGVTNAHQKAQQLYTMFEGAFVLSQAHKDVKFLAIQKTYIPIILKS